LAITYNAWGIPVNVGADAAVVTYPSRVKDRNFARPLQAMALFKPDSTISPSRGDYGIFLGLWYGSRGAFIV
jgi:hypothetical protein